MLKIHLSENSATMSLFVIHLETFFLLIGICPFRIQIEESGQLKIQTNLITLCYAIILFSIVLVIHIIIINFLLFCIFGSVCPSDSIYYSNKYIGRISDFLAISLFALIQSAISYVSIKNRQKHAQFLMKLYQMEATTLYPNLNSFPFRYMYPLIITVFIYFVFCVLLLKFEILHDNDDNNLYIFLLMIGYNIQFQATLSTAIYIRYLLLSLKIRIDEVAHFLQSILPGIDSHRYVRLAPHFERLWKYWELRRELGHIFGGHLLLMFSCSTIIVISTLFSLKKEVILISMRGYEGTGFLYDICANIVPPLILVVGLVQSVGMHGDQVI